MKNYFHLSAIPISVGVVLSLFGCERVSPFFPPDSGELIQVSAGTFLMGSDDGSLNQRPARMVYLSDFSIGKYEVTNRQFAHMLNWALARQKIQNRFGETYDGGGVYAHGQLLYEVIPSVISHARVVYNEGFFSVVSRNGYSLESHPVSGVTWFGAALFCNWLSESYGLEACYDTENWSLDLSKAGFHLPTEAQWERVAAWSTDNGGYQYMYGYGSDEVGCEFANTLNCNPLLLGMPSTTPVGWHNGKNVAALNLYASRDSPSPAGAYDMTGNVAEWCSDWYLGDYYSSGIDNDPKGPAIGESRVVRGGGYNCFGNQCGSTSRGALNPTYDLPWIGFRLARTTWR